MIFQLYEVVLNHPNTQGVMPLCRITKVTAYTEIKAFSHNFSTLKSSAKSVQVYLL